MRFVSLVMMARMTCRSRLCSLHVPIHALNAHAS
jgi:hypothetical protein